MSSVDEPPMIGRGEDKLAIQSTMATGPLSSSGSAGTQPSSPKGGRLKQSACRWCFGDIPLETLCAAGVAAGLTGIDLLQSSEYSVPLRYGLRCAMGHVGGNFFQNGLNRIENHDAIELVFRRELPLAAKAEVPNVVAFSGFRTGANDEDGLPNTVVGLRRLKKIAEDNGVTICLELLNSKVDHPLYAADHTAWGIRVVEEVNSPSVKLLYDIYHMQIMEGDVISTIRKNIQWIAHFHTGGVPGRNELDDNQEVNWRGVAKAIADMGFSGYVGHEFIPLSDPLTSLAEAVKICSV